MRWHEIIESDKSKEHRNMPDWKVKERFQKGIEDGTYVPDMALDDGDVVSEDDGEVSEDDKESMD